MPTAIYVFLGVVIAAYFLSQIVDQLKRLNGQIDNARYFLGEIDKRQQSMSGKLFEIAAHGYRANRDLYAQDKVDRNLPGFFATDEERDNI